MEMKKSAAAVALVLFIFLLSRGWASMPLTETIATLPEGGVGLILKEELFTHGSGFHRETAGISIGVLPSFTLSFYVHYIHRELPTSVENQMGDSFLRLWFYIGDFWDNTLHCGFMGLMRFPTGVNAYRNPNWQGLALGNNELRVGPVIQKDMSRVFLHFNLFYVFRERDREGFYNKLYLNPLEGTTYEKCFGLNFSADDTFLEPSLLRNDYIVIAVGVNTDRLFPVVPFAEVYGSFRPDRGSMTEDELDIEGGAVNPLMLSAGIRYFFSDTFYAGLYVISNLIKREGYFKEIVGVEASLQF